MADIRYYEVGFIDENYMDDTVDTTGYYLEGYLDDDYIGEGGEVREGECVMAGSSVTTVTPGKIMTTTVILTAFDTISMTASVIKNSFAILESSSSFLATVSKVAGNVVTLESIINQSLMDDTRIRTFTTLSSFYNPSTNVTTTSSSLHSVFFIDASSVTLFKGAEMNTSPTPFSQQTIINVTTDIDATLNSNITMSCDALSVTSDVIVSMTMSSGIVEVRPITYVLETRNTVELISTHNEHTVDSTNATSKFGSGSAFFDTTDNQRIFAPSSSGRTSNIIYDGTNYVLIGSDGKSWTNSDFTDITGWTSVTNNINSSLGQNNVGYDFYDFTDTELKYETANQPNISASTSYYVLSFTASEYPSKYQALYSTDLQTWYEGSNYLFSHTTPTNISTDYWIKISGLFEYAANNASSQVQFKRASRLADLSDNSNWYNTLLSNKDTDSGFFRNSAPRSIYDGANNYVAIPATNEIWIYKGSGSFTYSNVAQITTDGEYNDESRIVDYQYDGTRHYLILQSYIYVSTNGTTWTKWQDFGSAGNRIIGFANDGAGNLLLAQRDTDTLQGITLKQGTYASGFTSVSLPENRFGSKFYRSRQNRNCLSYLDNKFVFLSSGESPDHSRGFTFSGGTFNYFSTPYENPEILIHETSGSLSNFKTLDFWSKQNSSNQSNYFHWYNSAGKRTEFILAGNIANTTTARFRLFYVDANNNYQNVTYTEPGLPAFTGYITVTGDVTDWNHHRVIQDEGKLSYYLNGTRVYTSTNTLATDITSFGLGAFYPLDQAFVDELYISSAAENDPDDLTITVPVGAWQRDSYTKFLAHFDGNLDIDTSVVFDEQLDLQHNSSLFVIANTTLDANTVHLGTFTQQTQASVLRSASLEILSDFNVQADGISVVTMSPVTHSANFAIALNFDIAKTFTALMNVNTFTTSSVTRIKPLDATFEAIATSINVINKIGATLVDFADGVFSTTVNADRLRGIDSTSSSLFDITSTATHIKAFEINEMSVVSTVSADVNFRPDVLMDNGGLGTLLADVNVVRDAEASFESAFSASSATRGLIGFTVNTNLISTVEIDGTAIKGAESTLLTQFNLVSSAVKTIDNLATINSVATTNIDVNRTRNVETVFDSIASQASAVARIGDFLITLESAFTIETEVTKTSGVGGILDSVSDVNAIPTRVIDREIDPIGAEFTSVVNGTKGTDNQVVTSSSSVVEANVNAVKRISAEINDAVNFAVTVKLTRGGDIDLDSDFAILTDTTLSRTRSITTELLTENIIEASVTKIIGVTITTPVTVTVTADAKVIVIDSISYTIPRENRVFTINRENREHQVQFEQRETTIGA